jgi:hypothetical protein
MRGVALLLVALHHPKTAWQFAEPPQAHAAYLGHSSYITRPETKADQRLDKMNAWFLEANIKLAASLGIASNTGDGSAL